MDKKDKKFYIFTLGCQMNVHESERIAFIMKDIDYSETKEAADADIIIVNCCSVRQTAVDRVYGQVHNWLKNQKHNNVKYILTGCVMQLDRKKLKEIFDHIVDREESFKIPELLGERSLNFADYLSVPAAYNSKFQAYIAIMQGCDNFCTYCVVPYTRGREKSRPVQDILDEINNLIANGYKEITLLGQNVNSYAGEYNGKKISFPEILDKVAQIEGDFWIRFFTSHPYDMSDDLIKVMAKHDKICNYINLPVQSGDDNVLKRMNRHYEIKWYKNRINTLRKYMPDIGISTDLIVGFCDETEEEFDNTLKLFDEVRYDMAYVNKYSERAGTLAAKKYKDNITPKVKKDREKKVTEVLEKTAYENNKKYLNNIYRVLIDKVIKKNDKYLNNGRTETFKAVQFEANEDFTGKFVNVKITKVNPFSIKGEIII